MSDLITYQVTVQLRPSQIDNCLLIGFAGLESRYDLVMSQVRQLEVAMAP